MDRTIKFRAWNGEQMVSPDYITRDGYGHWKEDSVPTSSNKLMQFTGLLDCEGKEVWEGDIIEEFGRESIRKIVAWDSVNAAWGYKGNYENYNWAHDWGESQGATLQDMKVIGNIFEHSNLLQ